MKRTIAFSLSAASLLSPAAYAENSQHVVIVKEDGWPRSSHHGAGEAEPRSWSLLQDDKIELTQIAGKV